MSATILGRTVAGATWKRRGTYRVLHRINDELHEVVVLRIDHRGKVSRGP